MFIMTFQGLFKQQRRELSSKSNEIHIHTYYDQFMNKTHVEGVQNIS